MRARYPSRTRNPSSTTSSPNSNSVWSSHQPDGGVGALVGDLGDHRGQVREGLRHRGHLGLRHLDVAAALGRVEELLAEPDGPAAQRVQGVVGEVVGEAAGAQGGEHALVVRDQRRAQRGPRLQHRRQPLVAEHDRAGGDDPGPQRRGPVALRLRPAARADLGVQLPDDGVDHAVEQRLLVGDVVVERHRLDAELLAEAAHRQRTQALVVDQRDRRLEHEVAAQRPLHGLGHLGPDSRRMPTYPVSLQRKFTP